MTNSEAHTGRGAGPPATDRGPDASRPWPEGRAERRFTPRTYEALVESSWDIISVLDADGGWRFSSDAGTRQLGWPPGADPPGGLFDLIHPDDRDVAITGFADLLAGRRGPEEPLEVRVADVDGHWHWLETVGQNLLDDPEVRGIVLNSRDVTERRRLEETLRQRLALDQLVGRIVAEFAGALDGEEDRCIDAALAALGEHAGADRCYLGRYAPEGATASITHEWCAPGVPVLRDELQDVPVETVPWFTAELSAGRTVDLRRLADLPGDAAAEREFYAGQGICSLLAVPISAGGRLLGFVGAETVRDGCTWPSTVHQALRAAGSVFLGALARREARDARAHDEARFRALVQHLSDGIAVFGPDRALAFASPAALGYLGCAEGATLREIRDRLHPDDVAAAEATFSKLAPGGTSGIVSLRLRTDDGRWRTVDAVASDRSDDPAVGGTVVALRDVTHERAAEQLVAAQARILEMIARAVELPEVLTEICQVVEQHAPGVRCSVLVRDPEAEVLRGGAAPSLPREWLDAIDEVPVSADVGACGAAAATGEVVVCPDVTRDPRWRDHADLAVALGLRACWSSPVCAGDGEVLGTFAVYYDEPGEPPAEHRDLVDHLAHLAAIALERRAFEDRLAHQAYHDPLTGLPNRFLFFELVEHARARSERTGRTFAVLFLDLDQFKLVNDSLGHGAGDELLVAVARRLEAAIRPGDTVARFGGDEFAVLCEDVERDYVSDVAMRLAQRLGRALRDPVALRGEDVVVGASIGVALADETGGTPEQLVAEADTAMYRAKDAGRGRTTLFEPSMRVSTRERLDVERDLHRAIESDELVLLYQPIVGLDDGSWTGVEALVRWQHPERGLLGPGAFVPVAEETGLIRPLGAWVLRTALHQLASWRRTIGDRAPRSMSVNVSAYEFADADLAAGVAAALASSGIEPGALCLEITESALADQSAVTRRVLHDLEELGVRLSIDDFGTGYSSLAYLKRLPVSAIKIDRQFVAGLPDDRHDAAIVAAVVALAGTLGLELVAEGVETDAQRAALRELGCTTGQGFLFARPMPAGAATRAARRPNLATA